jgi:glycosyltransferase involved in cell wall biosynthesis
MAANTISSSLLELLDPSEAPPRGRRAVTYAGLVGHAQGLEVLSDVAERLPDVDFNIAGEGPDLVAIERDVRARGLSNVCLHGYVRPAQVADLYRQSDVLFAQLSHSALHTVTALPSKLFEYMAAGRPIVYGGDGLAAEAISDIGCGVSVCPGDADAICAAISGLLGDPVGAAAMAARGRRFVEDRPRRREAMLAAVTPQLEALVALSKAGASAG